MTLKVLFTTSKNPVSWLICSVTKEPASHCAIQCGDYVVHSTFTGVGVLRFSDFLLNRKIVAEVDLPESMSPNVLSLVPHAGYDYPALIYLGLRQIGLMLGIKLPKANLWNISGLYLCTEFVSESLWGKPDSLITPWQLYLKLLDNPPTSGQNNH